MKLNRAQVFALAVTGIIVVTAAPSCAHGQTAGSTPARPRQVTQVPTAQAPATVVGSWQADTPLPTGAVQTFRFAADGSFDLVVAVAVDGHYRVEGNKLIETATVPATGMAGTDTAAVLLRGDSLVLGDAASPGAKTLHRPASTTTTTTSAGKGILGDWVIMLPNGLAASYHFDPDGTSHIRAQVSAERGNYTVKGNTLRLTSERTFQLPATTTFSVSDSILTLTPANGHGARGFRRVSPR